MKIKRNFRQEDYINVVPFIDILLVLLIFFMVSSRFTHNAELRLDLPQADTKAEQQRQPDTVEISVYADGRYAVNGRVLVDQSAESLRSGLRSVAGNRTDIPLILSADAGATHQSVVTAMDVAGRLGFSKMSITTLHDEKNGQ